MPPKKKTKGKKSKTMRSRLSSTARGARKRASAAARYARRNPQNIAGGALGLGALGLGGYEAYLAARRHGLKKGRTFTGPQGLQEAIEFEKFKRSNPYASPTARAVRGVRDYNYRTTGSGFLDRIMPSRVKKRQQKIAEAEVEAEAIRQRNAIYGEKRADRLIRKRMEPSPEHRQQSATYMQLLKSDAARNDAARRSRMYQRSLDYGKRRRKRKSSFGKKVKKPSAATKRMCKKLKVRLTVKRGGKRVYKSEKVLKKQCKTAMKRKSKRKSSFGKNANEKAIRKTKCEKIPGCKGKAKCCNKVKKALIKLFKGKATAADKKLIVSKTHYVKRDVDFINYCWNPKNSWKCKATGSLAGGASGALIAGLIARSMKKK